MTKKAGRPTGRERDGMRFRFLWFPLACAATLAVTGCKNPEDASRRGDAAPHARASSMSKPPAAATSGVKRGPSAATSAATSASAPARARPRVAACKALAKGKLVVLGTHPGHTLRLAARRGDAYLLSFNRGQARIEVVEMPRDGSKPKVFEAHRANNEPRGFAVGEHAAYFTVGQTLVRVPFDGGKPTELGRDFSWGLALRGAELLGVQCKKHGEQRLVRLPTAGGSPTTVASLPDPRPGKCRITYIALDGDRAFLSDWAKRRVLRVDLADGSTQVLATKIPFPLRIAVGDSTVAFQMSSGIERVSKDGGKVSPLTSIGATPFHAMGWDRDSFFVLHEDAYSSPAILKRLPRAGGKPKAMEWFSVADITMGSGITDLAVDDQCVYLSRWRRGSSGGYSEVMARPKR